MSTPRRALSAALLTSAILSLCAPRSCHAQSTVHFPDRSYSTLSYGGSLWIGTPRGLYRYRWQDNVWSAYGPQNGLLSSAITALEVRNDVLWIGQDRGITSFDLRSNTMLHYDSAKGLASGAVRATAFEEDYVWTGGSGGGSRYDNLIEEWQSIGAAEGLTGNTVHAIVPNAERVFLATERGVNEYDPRHERWRMFAPQSAAPQTGTQQADEPILDAFAAGGSLWLLREGELLRFDMDARVFSPYPLKNFHGSDIKEIIVSGSGFWLVTATDLWQYDATADALRPFLEIEQLPDHDLRAVALSNDGNTLWFSTASGLTRFDRAAGSWTYFTAASGLPEIPISNLFPLGDGVVTFSDEALVYYLANEDRWYNFPLLKAETKAGPQVSLDPAAGSYADFGGGVRLDLSGSRSAWLWQDPLGQEEYVVGGEDPTKRNDLKARLDLGGGRRISAIYNDSDYEDVVYGAEYRGTREDVLQSLQWGDMRLEQGSSLLQQSMGIFGVGGRAVYGGRTERYGRSLLEVSTVSGHKTTARSTQVFQGRRRVNEHTVSDRAWLRKTFYSLRQDRRLIPLEADEVRLYRALYKGETPSRIDLFSTEIASLISDWRPLEEGMHYAVDREHSVIKLLGENSHSIMAVRLTRGGITNELLLCNDTAQYQELRNRYDIGQYILPSSLRLTIIDQNGIPVPLSQFGLDSDNDGAVDPDFMDYASGELRFPGDQPFPSIAYEGWGTMTYQMQVRYESTSASYILKKRYVVRGSEKVLVDGLSATAGEDYVLDYTSGYLVFTRDGTVLDDSRVEISYEYIRNDADERITQAVVTVSPSDFMQASVSGGSFHEQNAATPTRFVQGSGEVRWQSDALDIRLQPEYRLTSSDSATGDAAGLSAAISTQQARLSLQSTLRSDGYSQPAASDYAGGRLRSDHAVKGEYDMVDELRLFLTHRQRSGTDTLNGLETNEQTSSGGLQWVRADYPSVTLRGDYLEVQDQLGTRDRRGGRMDATWIPSSGFLEMTGLQSSRMSGYARLSEERVRDGSDAGTFRTQSYFLRNVLSPRPLFTVNTWYQGDARDRQNTRGLFGRDYQTDKFYIDVLMEHLRGLSLGGRLTDDVRQMTTSSATQDRYNSTSLQANARIAPGTWIDALQPFILYASVQHTLGAYRTQDTQASGLFTAFFTSGEGRIQSRNESTWYELRAEWRPTSVFLYSVNANARQYSSEYGESRSQHGFWQLLQRADYRPDSRALYGMQLSIRRESDGDAVYFASGGMHYTSSVWAERRLSRSLLLRLLVDGGWRGVQTDYADFNEFRIAPSGNLTLSLEDLPLLRRVELRVDAGYSYSEYRYEYYFVPAHRGIVESVYSNFYVDLYPHPVLFIRFRYFLRWGSGRYRILGLTGWEQPDAELQLVMQL